MYVCFIRFCRFYFRFYFYTVYIVYCVSVGALLPDLNKLDWIGLELIINNNTIIYKAP